jgi:hypothetical protein
LRAIAAHDNGISIGMRFEVPCCYKEGDTNQQKIYNQEKSNDARNLAVGHEGLDREVEQKER